MGRLLFVQEFGDTGVDPRWYFEDARSIDGRWRFTVRRTFPHIEAIQRDELRDDKNGSRRMIAIRRWIEENLACTVVTAYLDLSYNFICNPEASRWDQRMGRAYHGYYLFHFERPADATLFRLAHADLVTGPEPFLVDGPKPGDINHPLYEASQREKFNRAIAWETA